MAGIHVSVQVLGAVSFPSQGASETVTAFLRGVDAALVEGSVLEGAAFAAAALDGAGFLSAGFAVATLVFGAVLAFGAALAFGCALAFAAGVLVFAAGALALAGGGAEVEGVDGVWVSGTDIGEELVRWFGVLEWMKGGRFCKASISAFIEKILRISSDLEALKRIFASSDGSLRINLRVLEKVLRLNDGWKARMSSSFPLSSEPGAVMLPSEW